MTEVETKTLTNGLRVVHVKFPNLHSATLKLSGRAGSAWESLDELGVAHFSEHVVFEGTKKYSTYNELQGLINNVGGQHNGYTSENSVAYLAKVLSEDIEKSMEYLSQILIHPLINQKDVEKHRDIITQEIKMYEDNPVNKFFMDALKVVFSEKCRAQYPVIGTVESVRATSAQNILNYREKSYFACNFVLGIGSSLESELVFKLAEKYFSEMSGGKLLPYVQVEIPEDRIIFTQSNEKVQQTTLSISFDGYNTFDKRKYAQSVLGSILGGDDMSRLFTKIRQEKGMAYYVGCDSSTAPTYGNLDITVQLDKHNTNEVIQIIKSEIKDIITNGVNEDEFNRSKKAVAAAFAFDQEKVENQVNLYTKLALEQRNETYESILENYMNVTESDIKAAALDLFEKEPKLLALADKIDNKELEGYWIN